MKLKIVYRGPEKGKIVKADKIRVQQILFNLISNAIKFSPQTSTITVIVSESKVSDNPNPAAIMVKIQVVDKGIGINLED